MKQVYFLVLFCCFVFKSAGQAYTRPTKLLTIIPERTIGLNGGARATVGGRSRVVIAVKLPPNTKSWCYSFTTSSNRSGTQSLKLMLQLAGLITGAGITTAVISSINIPAGTASIDTYLMDSYNANLFLNKTDDKWRYYLEGFTTNTLQAIIPVTGIKEGLVYICLRNPGVWEAVNVQLEAVAEVYDGY